MSMSLTLALGRVISYAPRVMLHIVASLTDDSFGIIYDHNMFIVQAIYLYKDNKMLFLPLKIFLFVTYLVRYLLLQLSSQIITRYNCN